MGRMFASRDTKKKYISPGGLFGIEVAKPDGDDAPGVTITKIWPRSPAALAGLKEGDRLLTVDGRWTDSVTDAFAAATFSMPGQTVLVVLSRNHEIMEVEVRPVVGL
jgi:S1-C subfamily serine protease